MVQTDVTVRWGLQAPPPVGSVTILSPATFSIAVGATYQGTVQVLDINGDPSATPAAWSSSDPTKLSVNASTGLATGIAAGIATLTATAEYESDTALGTITLVQNPVATVTIPATASVLTGGSVIIGAVVRDAGGAILTGKIVSWADNGPNTTVGADSGDESHQVSIGGVNPGTQNVVATSDGVNSLPCVVTVSALSSAYPHAPAGAILEGSNDYSAVLTSGGWISFAGAPTQIIDGTAPTSPSTTMRQTWAAGTNGGSGSWNHAFTFPNYSGNARKRIYVGLTAKYSANWYNNAANGQKIFFCSVGDGIGAHGGGGQFYLWSNGVVGASAPMNLTLRFQGMPLGPRVATANSGYNGDAFAQGNLNGGAPARAITRDVWFRCEVELALNDPGVSNGLARLWVEQNGVFVLAQEFTDVVWLDATRTDRFWRGCNYTSVYGGGATPHPEDIHLSFDDTRVYGKAA